MKGFVITYKPKDSKSRTLLNHTLFGRLVYKNRRGKKTAYYIPGLLDNIRYVRLLPSKIYVEYDILNIYDEYNKTSFNHLKEGILDIFGDIEFKEEERDEERLTLITAKEHWEAIAEEKGYKFHVKRK